MRNRLSGLTSSAKYTCERILQRNFGRYLSTVVLKHEHASESPGQFVKTGFWAEPLEWLMQ